MKKKQQTPKVTISKKLAVNTLKALGIAPGSPKPETMPIWLAFESYKAVIAMGRQAAREGESAGSNPYNPLLNDYESLMFEAWRVGFFNS